MAALTPAQRSQRARIAAHTRWAKESPAANAARGQAGLLAKFLAEVDADTPGLPESERIRRAESLRRAHMARLAFRSAKVRGGRRARIESGGADVAA